MALSQRRARLLARLKTRKSREREGLVLVEGVRACRAALDCGGVPTFAVTSPRLGELAGGPSLAKRLHEAGVDALALGERELGELADTATPQGVLLVLREPPAPLEELTGRRFLVLDALQDPGNLGTLVRAAVAFGLDGVVCLDGTVDPWGPKSVRASAGMVFRLPPVRARVEGALSRLRELDVPVVVADARGQDVTQVGPELETRFALVVGNEGAGVRPLVSGAAERHVAIRMAGPVESLNAGVAGSILLYELSKESG